MWRKCRESHLFIGQWCTCYCSISDYCCHCLIVPYAKKPFIIKSQNIHGMLFVSLSALNEQFGLLL